MASGAFAMTQHVCLALALWNEKDPILKERMFGLTNLQGNHGEDVKEYYFFLDGTPTHSYMKMLYKYPQVAYPYEELVQVNGQRTQAEREFKLFDALRDVFLANRYFDVSSNMPRQIPKTFSAGSRRSIAVPISPHITYSSSALGPARWRPRSTCPP